MPIDSRNSPDARPRRSPRAPRPAGAPARVATSPLSTNSPAEFLAGLVLWILAFVILASPLYGQGFGPPAESRQGLWAGVGLGQGATWLRCEVCDGERGEGGLTGYGRVGTTVNDRLLLGADLTYWRRSEDDVLEQSTGLAGAAYWYPNRRHGYYLKLGLGYAWYRASEGEIALTSRLLTAVSGAGYEMRVNPRVSLVPFLNLLITTQGNLLREDTRNGGFSATRVADDLRQLSVQVGFGITRH